MTTCQPDLDRFHIDHGTNDAPPPRQTKPGPRGYIWHSTTQELIPILEKDDPGYEENAKRLVEAMRRWDRGTPDDRPT